MNQVGFKKITKGEPDWHIPVNENFEGIENGEFLPNNLAKTDEETEFKNRVTFKEGIKVPVNNVAEPPRISFLQGDGFIGDIGVYVRSSTDSETLDFLTYSTQEKCWQSKSAGKLWGHVNFKQEAASWDGVVAGLTVAGTFESSMNVCRYHVLGNRVFVLANIIGKLSNAQGALIMKNLPFVAQHNAPLSFGFSNVRARSGYVQSGNTFAYMHAENSETVDASTLNGVEFNIFWDSSYMI